MNQFFETKKIHVERNKEKKTFTMRPLKIGELKLYFDLVEKSKTQIVPELILLVSGTITPSILDLEIETFTQIHEALIELSFPDLKKKRNDIGEDVTFSDMVDFLISQGHIYSQILEYTTLQFNQLIESAGNRLSGKKRKKKMNAMSALLKIGIPVRGRK